MKSGIRFNHMGPQFAVEDVSRAVGFYAAVLGFVQPLEDLDYGQEVRFKVFAISDPAGNTLRIGEPLESTRGGDL